VDIFLFENAYHCQQMASTVESEEGWEFSSNKSEPCKGSLGEFIEDCYYKISKRREPSSYQSIQGLIRNQPGHDLPGTYFLLKLLFVTGMSHHTETTSVSPVFRIAAADIGELRSALPRVPALSVLLMQEQRCTVGF
jgi:hypothetical protein